MMVSEIKLYEILKTKLGEKEAEALVEFVDYRIKESSEANAKALATKEDIVKLEARIAETKSEIITTLLKWMVGLIIGLFIALVGTMTALMNLIK